MYPVKRTCPVKGSTTSSNTYRVKNCVYQNGQPQSPSPESARKVKVPSCISPGRQTSYVPHSSKSNGNRNGSPNMSFLKSASHVDAEDTNFIEKRLRLDSQSSSSHHLSGLSSLQPQRSHQTFSGQLSRKSNNDVQSSRKPSPGDPTNPMFIPGLIICLPPTESRTQNVGDLMTLFVSCAKSEIMLTLEAIETKPRQWTVKLFIQHKHICTGYGDGPRKSRAKTATQALDLLCRFQPCRYKSANEMHTFPCRIPGLKVYMPCAKPKKEECLDILMDNCMKCNLPVTWWDDRGGKVFREERCTVVLINGKPVSLGFGNDLGEAMKNTAMNALKALKYHVVIENEGECASSIDGASTAGPNITTPKLLGIDAENSSNIIATQTADIAMFEIPGSEAAEKPVGSRNYSSEKHKEQDKVDVMQSPSIKIPDLTLYLPSKKTKREWKRQWKNICGGQSNPIMIVMESCFKSNVSAKMFNVRLKENSGKWGAKLQIRNTSSNLLYSGEGVDERSARENAAEGALCDLRSCQPVVYKKPTDCFLLRKKGIDGFKLQKASAEDKETNLSQLRYSCEKCNMELTWWDDGGGELFGFPWTVALLINSRLVCWGHGNTLEEAKEATALTAIKHFEVI